MKLTKEFLEKNEACKEGIDFVINNNIIDKTINLEKTKGDYNSFIDWLKLLPKRVFDQNNNMIKQVNPSGATTLREYDNNNNKIKEVYPNGDTGSYEYDKNNNKIKEVYPDGSTSFFTFTHSDNKFIITENNESICTVVFE